MESRIFLKITNQFWILPNRPCFRSVSAPTHQETFRVAIGASEVGAHFRNNGQIDRQPAIEKWAVKTFETLDGRQRVGVVIAQDYVSHSSPRSILRRDLSFVPPGHPYHTGW